MYPAMQTKNPYFLEMHNEGKALEPRLYTKMSKSPAFELFLNTLTGPKNTVGYEPIKKMSKKSDNSMAESSISQALINTPFFGPLEKHLDDCEGHLAANSFQYRMKCVCQNLRRKNDYIINIICEMLLEEISKENEPAKKMSKRSDSTMMGAPLRDTLINIPYFSLLEKHLDECPGPASQNPQNIEYALAPNSFYGQMKCVCKNLKKMNDYIINIICEMLMEELSKGPM